MYFLLDFSESVSYELSAAWKKHLPIVLNEANLKQSNTVATKEAHLFI